MATDTWFSRDLPVLDAMVTHMDEHGPGTFPSLNDFAHGLTMDVEVVVRAACALEGSYIELRKYMGPAGHWRVVDVHPSARTATGQWPNPESLSERILESLEEVIDGEDEERTGKLRVAAEVLGSTAKGVGTSVLTAAILRATGIA